MLMLKNILFMLLASTAAIHASECESEKVSQEQVQVSVKMLENSYITSRDAFLANGGEEFLNSRRQLRSDYCDAAISESELSLWISSLPEGNAKDSFTSRFIEWNSKLEKGLLTKSNTPQISAEAFIDKLDSFYFAYHTLIENSVYIEFYDNKNDLRSVLLPELKEAPASVVAKKHGITDPELISRMHREWSWKG